MKRLICFIINILIGFFIDMCLFLILIGLGVDQLFARAISIGISFLLIVKPNRFSVFLKLRKKSFVDTLRYAIAGFFSSILNYTIYLKLLIFLPDIQPLLGMILSSIPSMLFVILLYTRFLFKKHSYMGK
ncbi:GtrA family protein [Candidatus Liberibacter americanus]|uniref:GtrA/DPMS transmembrane domain-containing protein n=1 Tax=Candidatus Liberibacter americanus str. Sao Paulo TaxID=1261131 RepID=U6B3A9_9HYPH|nr:GtrA family protein [Candidatus Liberibacter americanus]AHA27544.1 hypothetical protein lam_170 [Candidatus Liberibacter americanus str. Sao Paulo]EMS36495.1 hypothetical protein G653_01017 [Candidatus Liberibacter americanus PW_SP]